MIAQKKTQKKKPQDEEKEILEHCYCYAEKREITPNECLVVSISKRNNRKYCKKNKCASPVHLCLSCVVYGEVDNDSIVEIPGAPLCEFHTVNGFFVRKCENLESLKTEIHEQAKSIQDCIDLRQKNNNSIDIEIFLYDDGGDGDEDILDIDIEDIPSEAPLEPEQDFDIVHKK